MREYQKIIRIQKLSNFVGCIKKLYPSKIEILLLVVHIVIIILGLMNLLIIPREVLNNSLFSFRIVIFIFLIIQLIFLTFNQIFRKRKKLTYGYYFLISFYGTLFSVGLTILNFIFILISCIIIYNKVKNYKQKQYDYKSILIIDIFTLIIIVADFFLWFSEFLIIYAKTNSNLKEYIEAKKKFYESQNKKVVNIEINDNNFNNNNINKKNDDNSNQMKGKIIEDDIISNNKMEINEKEFNNIIKKKDDDISSVDTK